MNMRDFLVTFDSFEGLKRDYGGLMILNLIGCENMRAINFAFDKNVRKNRLENSEEISNSELQIEKNVSFVFVLLKCQCFFVSSNS